MMFHKLRIKFIILSMTSLFVLLFVIIAGMNVVNYKSIVSDADFMLDIIAENKGSLPPFAEKKLPPFMSPETPYEARYFSVVMNNNKQMLYADTSKIADVDANEAFEFARVTMEDQKERGFVEEYRFINQPENGISRITFLDMGSKIYSFQTFLKSSILMGVVGYIVFFIVILFFSGKIMKPVAESYAKQRRFITDAGHEIKTPLAIINADVDVLEMDQGQNEWLEDIHKQTKRLAGLTNDLVYLSRMEEEEKDIRMIEFPFSDLVGEVVSSFQAIAKMQNKQLFCNIPALVSLTGNEKEIRRLINILMDNAMKYSPEQGTIFVEVKKQGRNVVLTVRNGTLGPISKENLKLIFERFYRLDSSRSTATGGYGIGLSVAKAIVSAHSGKIYAETSGDCSLQIVVMLPI